MERQVGEYLDLKMGLSVVAGKYIALFIENVERSVREICGE